MIEVERGGILTSAIRSLGGRVRDIAERVNSVTVAEPCEKRPVSMVESVKRWSTLMSNR